MKDTMYFAPKGIEEAVRLLAEYGEKASLLAGGTDHVPKINYYEIKPHILIYIGGMGLEYIKEEKQELLIGAMATTAKLSANVLVDEKATALAEAARRSGSIAIRNAATIGGNLANASPAADLATPLLVMDAHLFLASTRGIRVVAIKDFFIGPGETVLNPDELIVEISISPFKGKTVFLKLGRRKAMTLSVVNVAVRLDMIGKTCNEARIALGSVAPTPMRCIKAEEMLKGKMLDNALIAQCASVAITETKPIDDQRATAWYRKRAGETLVVRALMQASCIES